MRNLDAAPAAPQRECNWTRFRNFCIARYHLGRPGKSHFGWTVPLYLSDEMMVYDVLISGETGRRRDLVLRHSEHASLPTAEVWRHGRHMPELLRHGSERPVRYHVLHVQERSSDAGTSHGWRRQPGLSDTVDGHVLSYRQWLPRVDLAVTTHDYVLNDTWCRFN